MGLLEHQKKKSGASTVITRLGNWAPSSSILYTPCYVALKVTKCSLHVQAERRRKAKELRPGSTQSIQLFQENSIVPGSHPVEIFFILRTGSYGHSSLSHSLGTQTVLTWSHCSSKPNCASVSKGETKNTYWIVNAFSVRSGERSIKAWNSWK